MDREALDAFVLQNVNALREKDGHAAAGATTARRIRATAWRTSSTSDAMSFGPPGAPPGETDPLAVHTP
jgi:hypothetical protein